MNERIRELAEQADIYFTVDNKAVTIRSQKITTNDLTNVDLEKFAKLIVRECAELCLQESNKSANNAWEQVRAKCDAQMILEHFGIEE